jgi:hypothetical protein
MRTVAGTLIHLFLPASRATLLNGLGAEFFPLRASSVFVLSQR